MITETYDYPKPKSQFPYTMRTTSITEHSRGIMWTADLLRDGESVGIIEQMGDGGSDRVIINSAQDRARWLEDVASAFFGSEENATSYLLFTEGG